MAADLVIRGGMVIDAEGGRAADVVIDAGSISALTDPGAGGPSRRLIDATGLAVFPGAIDAHVHFDAPGRDEWEGWETGSLAAVAGGVTTVIDMPIDSDPPTIDVPAVRAKCAAAQASSLVDFALWGGLVPQNRASLEELLRSGVVGLKAFMCDSGWADFPPCDVDVLSVGHGSGRTRRTAGGGALRGSVALRARRGGPSRSGRALGGDRRLRSVGGTRGPAPCRPLLVG